MKAELVLTGGPARLDSGPQFAACIANYSLTSSLTICKRIAREVLPLEGGFLVGEPKRGATNESEIDVSPRQGLGPRVADEHVECRFGPPRARP